MGVIYVPMLEEDDPVDLDVIWQSVYLGYTFHWVKTLFSTVLHSQMVQ